MRALARAFSAMPTGRVALGCAAAVLAIAASLGEAKADPAATGPFVAVEGQAVFGASDFDAGFVPDSLFDITGRNATIDEGEGWGGAITGGYAWGNGWQAAVRYRRLEADDRGGPIDPGLILFAPGVSQVPGGAPIPLQAALYGVDSQTSIVDFEIARDLVVTGFALQVFGGLRYADIARDFSVADAGCGCLPVSVVMGHDFQGVGPKIGLRGSVPLLGGVSFVGGGSIAALFGTSTFSSRIHAEATPSFAFKSDDDRTVVAFDGEAGLSFGIGAASLVVGYRVDAMLGALDTDQRVSSLVAPVLSDIGDRHDDLIAHGPFARLTVPLSGTGD